ncbi:MAG: hypothetical protein V4521_05040 [Pseudomonadota bacterium]
MAVGAGFVKRGLRDGRAGRIYDEMTGQKPQSTRDERLAARLRDNLRRRKTQARAFENVAEAQADSDDSPESGLSKSEG